jgi:ribokinase
MAKIVVIGSLNMDLIAQTPRLPAHGETIIGTNYLNEPGGKGANQAYAAAKLGGDVAMLGRIGADDYGRHMKVNLESVRCDVTGVQHTVGSSGIAMILVAASGQNSIVVVPGANYQYLPADLRSDAKHLKGARFVLLQLEIPLETVLTAAQVAKSQGALVILDPAPVPSQLPSVLLESIDVLTPNETEAAQLIGNHPASVSMDEARDIARRLQALGPPTVIIKLGERGCILADGNSLEHIAAPVVTALDTTAAGDVFNAAFAVASAEGASRIDACRFAAHAAALSVTKLGAQASMPTRENVQSILASTLNPHVRA